MEDTGGRVKVGSFLLNNRGIFGNLVMLFLRHKGDGIERKNSRLRASKSTTGDKTLKK